MGATAQTPANLVIGAGDVLADDADFGVTADDNTYRIEQEIFTPDNLNGVPGSLVDTHYKTKEEAVLEVTVPEVSTTALELQWPGSQSATVGTDTTIDSDGTDRRIPSTDYHDYELRVPGLNGKQFSFFADAALNRGTIELNGQNAGMMAPRLELHSNWNAADLTASPHRIVITIPAS
jgi:hypothetical protein